jgi:hypothetical protein
MTDSNITGSAATLTTPRGIYGNNFDGSAALTQVIASTYGGTGNGFTKFSGPTTAEKTFTLPDASATILTTDALVTSAQGGTGNGFTAFTGPTTSEKTFTLPNASATILTTNAAVTVGQGGTGLGSGTSGGIPYFSATNTMASSGALTVNAVVLGGGAGASPTSSSLTATVVKAASGVLSAATSGTDYQAPNTTYSMGTAGYLGTTYTAGTGGTTNGLIVKLDSSAQAITATTGDTGSGVLGISATTASSGNPADIAIRGKISCIADNSTTVNNLVGVGTTTAGRCKDLGQSSFQSVSGTLQVLGRWLAACTAGNSCSMQIFGPGHYGGLTSGADLTDTTVTPSKLTAAARQETKSANILDPTTSDTNKVQFAFANAVTIQRVWCSTDTGTVTIQFDERAEATPNTAGTNVLTSSLACDNDTQATTGFSNATIAQYVPMNLQITATSGTPTIVRIHVAYQPD